MLKGTLHAAYIDDVNESQHADFYVYYGPSTSLPYTVESAFLCKAFLYKNVSRVFDKYVYGETFKYSLSAGPIRG